MLNRLFHPDKDDIAFVLIDFQDKVLAAVEESIRRKAIVNVHLLLDLARLLHIPVVVTEEYSRGLGKTAAELVEKLGDLYLPIEKQTFSAWGAAAFVDKIERLGVKHLVLGGVEAHVCVLQTALDLLSQGYAVSILSDAVCSRYKSDWRVGLRVMEQAGAVITSTEVMIFQLLKRADTTEFKLMSPLLKERLQI